MQRMCRLLCLLMLMGAVSAPLAIARPAAFAQDRDDHDRDHRYYDPYEKTYHNWDQREDGMYRRWLETKHWSYRNFDALKENERRDYWKWRHDHAEHEEHEH